MTAIPHLEAWQWALLYFATFCTGLSKTGIAGVGVVSVGLFPLLLPPREAVGSVLLMLIGADIVAVTSYRRNAEWQYLWRLFPWAAVGVVFGYLAMGRIADDQARYLIGGILLLIVVFQVARRLRPNQDADTEVRHSLLVSAMTGILAGFTTMVANAAGPIMIIYFLSMGLPKLSFIGTSAWYFFFLNLFKVPFGIALGTVTLPTLKFALMLFPGALLGGLVGRSVIKHIDQKVFEWLALSFTLVAGLKMIWPLILSLFKPVS